MPFIQVAIPKRFRYLWLWTRKNIVMTSSHIDQVGDHTYTARGVTQGLFGQDMVFTLVYRDGYWTILN